MRRKNKDASSDFAKSLTNEQLNEILNELVRQQSLSDDALDRLKDLPREAKITLVASHIDDKEFNSTEQYIDSVVKKPLKEIGKLRVALNTKPISFVVDFSDKNGISVIEDILSDSISFFVLEEDYIQHQDDSHPFLIYKSKVSRDTCDKLSYEASQCVKPLIKIQDVLSKVLENNTLLTLLCLYTTYGSYQTRKIACETLTIIVYYDQNLVGRVAQCFSNAIQVKEAIVRQHYSRPGDHLSLIHI